MNPTGQQYAAGNDAAGTHGTRMDDTYEDIQGYKVYSKLKDIGSGRFARTIKAKKNNNSVAAKLLLRQIDDQFMQFVRNLNEEVTSENVTKIFDIVKHNRDVYIFREYLSYTLNEFMQRRTDSSDTFESQKLIISENITAGLKYLHDDLELIHGNLHPRNILVTEEMGEVTAKITDYEFGQQKYETQSSNKLSQAFTSPEEIAGRNGSQRSDVFSWGLLLLTILQAEVNLRDEQEAEEEEEVDRFWPIIEGKTEPGEKDFPIGQIMLNRKMYPTLSPLRIVVIRPNDSDNIVKMLKQIICKATQIEPSKRGSAAEHYDLMKIINGCDESLGDPTGVLENLEIVEDSPVENEISVQGTKPGSEDEIFLVSKTVELGGGTFGTVYEARMSNASGHGDASETQVAAKVIPYSKGKASAANEYNILTNVPHHENVVKLFNWSVANHVLYIFMELCGYGNLNNYFSTKGYEQYFSKSVLLPIMRHVANGIKHLHDNKIMHRDLKPANILIARWTDGESERIVAKISDFGLSKDIANEEQSTGNHTNCGTRLFKSPEFGRFPQIMAKGQISLPWD